MTTGLTGAASSAQALSKTVDELLVKVHRLQDWLRIRDLTLTPALLSTLARLSEELHQLTHVVQGDTVEQAQLKSLARTSTLINSSLELDEVLSRSMEEVIRLTNAERGFILLKEGENIDCRVASGAEKFEGSQTILQDVLTSGHPLLTEEAMIDPRLMVAMTVAHRSLRSVVCVPLTVKEQIIGAVYVDNHLRAGVFGERELRVLLAFANQAAVAIQNARLYQQVQNNIAAITALKNVIDNVFASLGSGVVTTDANDVIMLLNHSAAALLQHNPQTVLGQNLFSVFPNISADFPAYVQNTRQGLQALSLEADVQLANGRKDLRLHLSPLKASDTGATQGVTLVIDDLTEEYQRNRKLETLRKYLPPGMVENIQHIAGIALGGERRVLTCVFVDVRPISNFPAGLSPTAFIEMLNQHLAIATDCINAMGGIIDKYMGTEVMALFNTQLNQQPDDHALRAVQAALNMRASFPQLYTTGEQPLFRIGIHSGEATVGNVGTTRRRDFTALGDTINLAHRLLENAEAGQVIISADVQDRIAPQQAATMRFLERGSLTVKGRNQATSIWEVFRQ